MEPLATTTQLAARLPRTLDPGEYQRAQALLEDASGLFRSAAYGQIISLATSTALRLVPVAADPNRRDIDWFERDACYRYVVAPQRPIVSVASVTDTNEGDVDFEQLDTERIRVVASGPVLVTYTHGYDPVPDDVVAAVCAMVTDILGTAPEGGELSSETIGSYSYSKNAGATALALTTDMRALAQAYGRGVSTARML